MMVGSAKVIITCLNVFRTLSERIFPMQVLLLMMISLFGNLVKLYNGSKGLSWNSKAVHITD